MVSKVTIITVLLFIFLPIRVFSQNDSAQSLFLIKKTNFMNRHPLEIGCRVIVRTETGRVKGKITGFTDSLMDIGGISVPIDKIKNLTVKKPLFYVGRGLYAAGGLAYFLGINLMYYNDISFAPLIPGTVLLLTGAWITSTRRYNHEKWDLRLLKSVY